MFLSPSHLTLNCTLFCDIYQVLTGDVHDLLTSHKSKPVVHGCTLPEIGNGQLMKKQTGNIMVILPICLITKQILNLFCTTKLQYYIWLLIASNICGRHFANCPNSWLSSSSFFYYVKYQQTGGGKLVSTHLPPLPVQAVAQQQVKELSKRSSASRHGFEGVPVLPAGEICLEEPFSHISIWKTQPRSFSQRDAKLACTWSCTL